MMLYYSGITKDKRRERQMAEFQIREVRPEDFGRGFLETLERLSEVGLTPKQARKIYENEIAKNPAYHLWVAEIDRTVVGVTTMLVEQKFIHRGGKVGHIEDVAVRKGFGGGEIGRALVVETAGGEARKEGCYKTILDCNERNAKLYEKWGFRKHEIGMRMDLRS